MSAARPITIIGGGLAGLTLGIALRQRAVPVTLFEADGYPRHRVCGEFISGGGLEVLRELGLRPKLLGAGALEAWTSGFHHGMRSFPVKTLPHPALCVSRHRLDTLLADEFRALGGELRERERWPAKEFPPGSVRATGRRLQPRQQGPQWIGLKAHANGVPLTADLEMHLVPSGYVGLCRVEGGAVNVCGLFRVDGPQPGLAREWKSFLGGPPGSALRARLAGAEFDETSFRAIAGLNLRPDRAAAAAECRIGDALTMIPPVTGNGMSMAFESAAWAAAPLADFSRGELAWDEARKTIARRCDAGFARRLQAARWVQGLLRQPWSARAVLELGGRCDALWRLWYRLTR